MGQESMPSPTVPSKPFSEYKALSFDIYGTLIDWESGISIALEPLRKRLADSKPKDDKTEISVRLFAKYEAPIEAAHPTMIYSKVLSETYLRIAEELGLSTLATADGLQEEAAIFGASVGEWPAFPDTVKAMETLAKHYKLIVLSNVDKKSFAATCDGPLKDVHFDAKYVAEDIGSFKPDLKNFDYLLEGCKREFGVEKEQLLHVAASITHDQRPAKKMGLSSVWVSRENSVTQPDVEKAVKEDEVGYGWKVATLGELAEMITKE